MSVFDRYGPAMEEFIDGADVVEDGDADEVILKVSEVEDPEAGTIEGEIAEVKEEIDTAERDIEELETKAEAIEAFEAAVEDFAKDGGMNPQAAALIHGQMAGIMASVGVESYSLAAEQFDGKASRARNTEPALEAIGDTLKKVWEFIKRIAAKLWNFLKDMWSKISFQLARVKARAIKIQNAANNLRGHTSKAEVAVGGNSYLYLNGEFIGQNGQGLKALNEFTSASAAMALTCHGASSEIQETVKGSNDEEQNKRAVTKVLKGFAAIMRAGKTTGKAPIQGDSVVKLPLLPGNKTIFISGPNVGIVTPEEAIKALKKINAVFATDPEAKAVSKVDKVKVSSASDIVSRMKSVISTLGSYESGRKGNDSVVADMKKLAAINPDGFEKKAVILKVVRQAITAIRKLCSGSVVGAHAHFLSTVSALNSFSAREVAVLAKDKKKGGKSDDKKDDDKDDK